MIELANLELNEAQAKVVKIEDDLKKLLIPKDPDDPKNIVMELRAGTGGDEASIFAGDLFRMYSKYAEKQGWKVNLVDYNEGTAGGYKEIIFEVNGENVYGTMKFESGVHRVQRVPQTETQGRVHTSAATVIVLPEAEEFDVELNMQDVRIERTTSTGPGGQSVNTTYSAIKLHHEPTGIIVSCQDQKSQHKNLDKALKADSSSSAFGAFLGCAPVTSYVESSAGVQAGGKTGLTAVTVGFLFLIAVFFSPLASIIPAHATAGALIYVSILMMSGMEKLNWSDSSELLPALIIIVMIPLTFSIANGIALGFISYVVLKIASGQFKKISSGAWFLAIVFLSKFLFL